MNKWTKLIAMLMAVAFAACLFAGCAAPAAEGTDATPAADAPTADAPAATSKVDAIKAAGKLVMLTNAAFAPFEYLDDNNNVVGVDVDIAKAIAAKLGVELEVVDMDFDGIVAAIMSGKGDLGLAGMTATDERRKSVEFSVNYVDTAQYIIVRKDNTTVTKPEDLAGKTVGVQMGTTGDLFVTDNTEANPQRYKTGPDAAMELVNGRLDAVVLDEMPSREIVSAYSDLMILEAPLTEEQYAIAIAKENTDLKAVVDEVLTELLENGSVDQFIANHKNAM